MISQEFPEVSKFKKLESVTSSPKIVEIKDENIFQVKKVRIRGIDDYNANQIRKIIIGEIPTLAIDIVTIDDNTTILPDEILVNRLGYIPVLSNSKNLLEDDEKSEITFKVDILAHGIRKVYSDDFISNNSDYYLLSEVELITLRPGQKIELEAQVKRGIGQTHSKWSPVSSIIFEKINNDIFEFLFEPFSLSADEIISTAIQIYNRKINTLKSSNAKLSNN